MTREPNWLLLYFGIHFDPVLYTFQPPASVTCVPLTIAAIVSLWAETSKGKK